MALFNFGGLTFQSGGQTGAAAPANKSTNTNSSSSGGSSSGGLGTLLSLVSTGKNLYNLYNKVTPYLQSLTQTTAPVTTAPVTTGLSNAAPAVTTDLGVQAGTTMGQGVAPAAANAGYTAAQQAAIGAGESGFGGAVAGQGATSLGAGGWASLAAPIVMAWMANSAGSGANVPKEKDYSIITGLGDLAKTYSASGGQPSTSPTNLSFQEQYMGKTNPGGNSFTPQNGETFSELYHRLHSTGGGTYFQTSSNQQSTLSDKDIDNMLASQYGINHSDIERMLGYSVPDWNTSTGKYADWYNDQQNKAIAEASVRLGKPTNSFSRTEMDAILGDWDFWAGKPKASVGTTSGASTANSSQGLLGSLLSAIQGASTV